MKKWEFKKLEIIDTMEGMGATTHDNSFGERLTLERLKIMASKGKGILIHREHQFNSLPLGRIRETSIVELEGGEFGCKIFADLYVLRNSIKGTGLSFTGSPSIKSDKPDKDG